MKTESTTYQLLTQAVTVLLLAGLLFPSALHAKQFADFCMADKSSHQMMNSSHDCCLKEINNHHDTQNNKQACETNRICACSVDATPQKHQIWAPIYNSSAVILSQTGFHFTVISPDEVIHNDLTPVSYHYNPPLYLLYDTFLN